MCGIVGLFAKDQGIEPQLGALLTDMLVTMTDRGPDSAGVAIYGGGTTGRAKITVRSDTPDTAFPPLATALAGHGATLRRSATHAVIDAGTDDQPAIRAMIRQSHPAVAILSTGDRIEIYKEVGLPRDVSARFGLPGMGGTHGIGHTRMATESAVTTMGAHPFSTGADQCLVHNGSLSNHNDLRRKLRRAGTGIDTENDSEVAAAYLTWRMGEGATLGTALEGALDDLDGFYTFVVGTRDGFGVLRDPVACKPAMMAETDAWVAFGSEYRALATLPGIESARVWEPEPATVYFWSR